MTYDGLEGYKVARRVTLQAVENLPPLLDTGWIARTLDNALLKVNDNVTFSTLNGKVPFRVIAIKYHSDTNLGKSSNDVRITSETHFVLISADKKKRIF